MPHKQAKPRNAVGTDDTFFKLTAANAFAVRRHKSDQSVICRRLRAVAKKYKKIKKELT